MSFGGLVEISFLQISAWLQGRHVLMSGAAFVGAVSPQVTFYGTAKLQREVWKEAELVLPVLNQPTRDFVDVVWALKERKVDLNWDLFAITAWLEK